MAYEDGAPFLDAARAEPFDLAFLDIYMEGLDGLAAAGALREFDEECVLVFTTTSPEHALDGYRVRAFQYLVKPYGEAEVEALFDELDKRLPAPERWIEVREDRRSIQIPLGEILWAEHFQHQVHIHTTLGETITRMNFGAFTALLDERFFICGRGVAVNLSRVSDFDGAAFRLGDGGAIPVSRSLSDDANRAFGAYLFRKGMGA